MVASAPRVSIIIPTHNHAAFIREAIDSALAQTVPCEVIVIDDGSEDDTAAVLEGYRGLRVIRLPHGGPSVARNVGIDQATGEFLMFLDADDVIAPTKVEEQLAAFDDEIGWVLCDVRIDDEAKGRTVNASDQYHYASKAIGGWIAPLLATANFIPIMSPLIRRSVVAELRFDDTRVPEDWHFWQAVASRARVRYVPKVLATYRHRRTGRSRLPKAARAVVPNIELPLRLNLGCGTPGTRSWHPMPGFVNLDKNTGWRFEDGLKDFQTHSVAAISISHALMYLPEVDWPAFLSECARVMVEGGVLRITEDETQDTASRRRGGWKGSEPALTLTSPAFVRAYLERAGLAVHDVTAETTRYRDASLRQAQHGVAPDVFFIEGVKVPGVLFAPHSDDEALFASFTILRYRPRVVICFPSTGDYGSTETREAETRDAMSVLGASAVEQWDGRDIAEQMSAFDERVHPVRVWAPHFLASHPDHVAVSTAAATVFGERVTWYHTYDHRGKVRDGHKVEHEPAWISQKMRALLRYESQMTHPRAHKFFLDDLHEFQEPNV